jgi:hypothetical protein
MKTAGLSLGITAGALLISGAISASFASVPPAGRSTDGTALEQSLSEIRTPRQGKISFDADIQRLNQMEHRYRERPMKLASRPAISNPIRRISAKKYKYSGPADSKKAVSQR